MGMNMQQMMRQAQKMQKELQKAQQEIAERAPLVAAW